ncbi:MAG TPA: glycosyltransferase family 9 protein [Salinivirgaceae bacterium]|nr:glycosyltransferase family 9 protein [Salinivirgaceae bacterium]
MNKIQKILIIRFSSIGDIVLTTPLLRAIKKERPEIEIHFLVKREFYPVVEYNPNIDKVHKYRGDLRDTIESLHAEKFDFIVDLQNNIRSHKIKRRLGVKSAKVNKLNIKKWLYVNFKINKLPDRHIVDRYFETLSTLGVKNDFKGLEVFSEPNADKIFEKLEGFEKKNYVVVATGAAHYTKQVPSKILIEILNKVNKPVIFTGGSGDIPKAKKIIKKLTCPTFNACGLCSIGQTSEIVKYSKVVITPDTGVMHIAAAHYRPTVSVWGNTVPAFGMYPYMPQNQSLYYIAEVNNLKCRPCSKIGYKKCPKKHFNCMKNQDIDKIVDKIERFWQLE